MMNRQSLRMWVLVGGVLGLVTFGASATEFIVQSSFRQEENTWSIEAKAEEITCALGAGELIRWTVRWNGSFVHSEKIDGGRMIGCKYGYGAESNLRVEVLGSLVNPVGWIVYGSSVCGNTHSLRATVVVPHLQTSLGAQSLYSEMTFDCKTEPYIWSTPTGLEVWTSSQEWGAGGTATSIVVPIRFEISDLGFIRRSLLPGDFSQWPALESCDHFLSRFVAGLRERNPLLMQKTLDEDYSEDLMDSIEAFGLPSTRAGLTELILATEDILEAEERIQRLTSIGWRE